MVAYNPYKEHKVSDASNTAQFMLVPAKSERKISYLY